MMLKFRSVSVTAAMMLLSLPATMAGTPNADNYPALDEVPPANASWSANILQNIPNIPINHGGLPNPDWTKDVTTCPDAHQWGLTYDDGPGPYTADLLSVLASHNQLATFFIVGSRVVENPSALLQTYQAGHQIGIHTWSHPNSTAVSNEQYVAEIVYTAQIIKEVIGVTPRFFRPPYGDIDDRIRAILLNLGLTIVEWNVDSQDADGALDVAQQFQTKANAGSDPVISLEHDLFATSEPQAGAALDAILAGSGKYTPMPLDKCLGYAAYDEGFWDRVAGKGLPPVNPNPVSPSPVPSHSSTPTTSTATRTASVMTTLKSSAPPMASSSPPSGSSISGGNSISSTVSGIMGVLSVLFAMLAI
ncbi:hypothetical protein BASA61_004564 [Batrachochytrium salamandrivorans]|nr:hypothetical protein BASA61_004564 [Batrachochytrium salamandrivorans]